VRVHPQDAFQFYEEVGKGRFTVVYKGRRKHSIDYVAIKCVERHQLEAVGDPPPSPPLLAPTAPPSARCVGVRICTVAARGGPRVP
jgi:hypothetical protein